MSENNNVIELDCLGGRHINNVCKEAATMARESNCPVHFVFNDTHVTAQPGEMPEILAARWNTDYETAAKAWRESPESKAQEKERASKEKAADEAHLIEASSTEAEMREAEVPSIRTKEQLAEYVESLVRRPHDYGTCVYALSMASEAAFNYVAHVLGVSGFQASCADLDFIRRTRSMKGPFMLIKAEDALYPQYDLVGNLLESLEKWKPWLKETAEKNLSERNEYIHPNVLAHWKKLAESR